MAVETATKFLERMEREHSLREQFYVSAPKTLTDLTDWARGKGFLFSEDEFIEALNEYRPRFATGSVEPLKQYVERYQRVSALEERTPDDSASE